VATLKKHASTRARTTAAENGDKPAQTRSARHRRATAPRSWVAYGIGTATVCSLALVNLLAGQPATATVEPTGSVAVAEALGIDGTEVQQQSVAEPAEALGQLAASRAERDEEQATAALLQSRAEQAAATEKAEAERKAAEEAAAAAAAQAEAEAAAAAAEAEAEATEEAAAPAAEAAPAPAGTAVTAVANISNTAGPIQAAAQAAADVVVSNVPGAGGITIGGTRPSATDPGGHPSGLALDWMVLSDAALGDAIAQYHIDHWDELGVEYIIWQQRYLGSPGGSWSTMEDRGSTTANHYDHVHVNYRG
jgi:hypothetical protein